MKPEITNEPCTCDGAVAKEIHCVERFDYPLAHSVLDRLLARASRKLIEAAEREEK